MINATLKFAIYIVKHGASESVVSMNLSDFQAGPPNIRIKYLLPKMSCMEFKIIS